MSEFRWYVFNEQRWGLDWKHCLMVNSHTDIDSDMTACKGRRRNSVPRISLEGYRQYVRIHNRKARPLSSKQRQTQTPAEAPRGQDRDGYFIMHHGQQSLLSDAQKLIEHHSAKPSSWEPPKQNDPRPHQSRLKCGTSSRLFEFRNKVGFGGILSSTSERELAKDRVTGDGKVSENVVTFSQDSVARRSRGEATSTGPTPFGEWRMVLRGSDTFGVDVPQVRWLWGCRSRGSS